MLTEGVAELRETPIGDLIRELAYRYPCLVTIGMDKFGHTHGAIFGHTQTARGLLCEMEELMRLHALDKFSGGVDADAVLNTK